MHRMAVGILALVLFGPALWALDEPKDKPKNEAPQPSAQEQFQTLQREYSQKQQEAVRLYQEAMGKVQDALGPRFLELAEKHPKTDAGFQALNLVVNAGATGAAAQARLDKAYGLLAADYADHPQIGALCQRLMNASSPAGDKLLRAVMEKHKSADLQGQACYYLAMSLKNRAQNASAEQAEQLVTQAEEMFQRLLDKHAAAKLNNRPLGTMARSELAGLRTMLKLAIGKVAPEIEGEDIDGNPFKLSDYRGKVVVLDFWGHW
jgi:hypothetical protein